jgi:hypothetical protein
MGVRGLSGPDQALCRRAARPSGCARWSAASAPWAATPSETAARKSVAARAAPAAGSMAQRCRPPGLVSSVPAAISVTGWPEWRLGPHGEPDEDDHQEGGCARQPHPRRQLLGHAPGSQRVSPMRSSRPARVRGVLGSSPREWWTWCCRVSRCRPGHIGGHLGTPDGGKPKSCDLCGTVVGDETALHPRLLPDSSVDDAPVELTGLTGLTVERCTPGSFGATNAPARCAPAAATDPAATKPTRSQDADSDQFWCRRCSHLGASAHELVEAVLGPNIVMRSTRAAVNNA